jgi:uncharacterized repeat protein (TIGR02543 family)
MKIEFFKKISYIFIWITISIFFFMQQEQVDEPIELMYEVSSISEANKIANTYELELLEFNDYGFAIFQTNQNKQLNDLIDIGFEINGTYQTAKNPIFDNNGTDPFYTDQYAIPIMEVDDAWSLELGDPTYVIAIVDTGIDTDHVEFTNRISANSYNAVTKTVGLPAVEDTNGHGTNVAGVIGANKDNGEGIAGIVQNSILLVIKANEIDDPSTPDQDESDSFKDSSLVEAIRYATEHGADIINMSLGGSGYNNLVQNAINDAHAAGVIIVASSGNDGTNDTLYPASYNHVISVGAVDSSLNIAAYSNFNSDVDISAPGTGIVTTHIGDTYVSASGTSFSAPQVTGVIALLQSYLPELTDQQIIDRIYQTTLDQGSVGKDDYYGWGVINAYQAMLLDPITITFETYNALAIAPIEVEKNQPFTITAPQIDGYIFDGWYLDEAFTLPFIIGVDTLSVDTTLYAKFIAIQYTISFVTDGTPVDDIITTYNQTFILPSSEKDGFALEGWYLDQNFTIKYVSEPVTSSFTLYAKFVKTDYIINFYIDDVLDQTRFVEIGTSLALYIPSGDSEFIGWYLEPTFITLYQDEVPTSDLNLYARFDDGRFVVTYYDSDQTTVYIIQYVSEGHDAIIPEGPKKPSTPSLEFEFIGWSNDGLDVTSDLSIYPKYEVTYDNRSIKLRSGLDTVNLFEIWTDAGISVLDGLLSYEVTGSVDTQTAGRYIISYVIYYDGKIIDTIDRYVNVVEPQVMITLNPDVTTIFVGESYVDQGAISNVGPVQSTGVVDTTTIGTYVITYSVTYQQKVYTKSKYVYVLEAPVYESPETLYIIPQKKEWVL